jgi:hypothetical protein
VNGHVGQHILRGAVALFGLLPAAYISAAGQPVTQSALRAAFLYNFAKFTEWPVDPSAENPLILCVVDDGPVESALGELVGGAAINGRPATVWRGAKGPELRTCHLLYLGETNTGRAAAILDGIQGAPVLTVSNGDEFIRLGGIVGLFIEDGRMRFAINPEAAQRSGVRLSSRLLKLAKILKDDRR